MISLLKCVFISVICCIYHIGPCHSQTSDPPRLVVYSPGDLEYSDVVVRRVGDNLTLQCEVRGDDRPQTYVWNYVPANGTLPDHTRSLSVESAAGGAASRVRLAALSAADGGHYLCSAPPFSVSKFVVVQARGGRPCARGAYTCGLRCVPAAYLCDGLPDCERGEDEAPATCPRAACGAGRLACRSGRCVPRAACCARPSALCRQPDCCAEHAAPRAPPAPPAAAPDYGLVHSTMYSVTACALIFMVAVVLLVSAVCKMHMKRLAGARVYRAVPADVELRPLGAGARSPSDTYTLNGRTITLLGAELALPPPYAEAVGKDPPRPPPIYLSRECLARAPDTLAAPLADTPPRYDDLPPGDEATPTLSLLPSTTAASPPSPDHNSNLPPPPAVTRDENANDTARGGA